ncbi:AraC family transcriptional regulator [Sphingomonas sp. ID1715]|uniref:AraC family transcriptional regulator n=1 Tax=Sphingomonas sp. ID1715 TaxID=1656898 RepID=UPI0014878A0D|nr:helix-turn-helix domain-containing protein [Sphingomonas sp. ID1715]NNM76612.1 AraC family transcriptional regulator [Sphingomonas sp. ID1715]
MRPAGFHLDYWMPDPRLRDYVSGYHLYATAPPTGDRHHDVFFPAWANIRLLVQPCDWTVRIGSQQFTVPEAALFGPTSHAGYSASGRGMVAGAGLTPLGWYRLMRAPAYAFADRVSELAELLGSAAADLQAKLATAGGEGVNEIFDAFFLARLGRARPGEARVVRVHHDLMKPLPGGVAAVAERLGISHRTLHRLALEAFGFGPKLLVRRARFLRSLMAVAQANGERWADRIEGSYYDHSHFNRDAQEFLGMAPGDFLRLPKPINEASARLRTKILGAPAQALLQPRLTGAR